MISLYFPKNKTLLIVELKSSFHIFNIEKSSILVISCMALLFQNVPISRGNIKFWTGLLI